MGRELPAGFELALQVAVRVDRSRETAVARFESSQVYSHLRSLSRTTLKDQDPGDIVGRNLVGTPEQVVEQVAAYAEAGVDTLAGLLSLPTPWRRRSSRWPPWPRATGPTSCRSTH